MRVLPAERVVRLGCLRGKFGHNGSRGAARAGALVPTAADLMLQGVHQVPVEEQVDPGVHAAVEAVEQHQDGHRRVCRNKQEAK